MDHVIRFEGIPMSKSMRGMCKEEDYAFLGEKEKRPKETETLGEDWKEDKVERVWRRRERAQQEEERLRELEESKKDFQRSVLEEEMSLQTDSESSQALDQLLTRI
ncbi:golgin subfamily A member 6-like protein 22 [Salmo salar]|uniref:Golgin subfamily A member 6-like protein 22 n=1 Tax=Salmo salar TaxID=8030 RepID=A0ABM3EEP8_SALSA|nr:golgin subfamily A member 6-like protein 22 [Salmo salar]|eukprot:XP_014040255.1 PREDICTED: golgin subfamily A member 6-like protein 22 isoform X3 [Salmo salar]